MPNSQVNTGKREEEKKNKNKKNQIETNNRFEYYKNMETAVGSSPTIQKAKIK